MLKMKGVMSITFKILKKNIWEPKKKACKALRKMPNRVIHTILDIQEMITKTEINSCLISNLRLITRIKRIDMQKKLMRKRKIQIQHFYILILESMNMRICRQMKNIKSKIRWLKRDCLPIIWQIYNRNLRIIILKIQGWTT